VYCGEEITSSFVIAGGDSAELFKLLEEVFDQMASFIQFLVVLTLHLAVGLGWNHRGLSRLLPRNQNSLVGIKAFIRQQDVGLQLGQQHIGALQVAGLSAGEMKSNRVAQRVHGGVNLGAQPAFAAPDGLVDAPFFSAPALC